MEKEVLDSILQARKKGSKTDGKSEKDAKGKTNKHIPKKGDWRSTEEKKEQWLKK